MLERSQTNTTSKTWVSYGNSHVVEFMYLVFTHIPGESYCRRLRSLVSWSASCKCELTPLCVDSAQALWASLCFRVWLLLSGVYVCVWGVCVCVYMYMSMLCLIAVPVHPAVHLSLCILHGQRGQKTAGEYGRRRQEKVGKWGFLTIFNFTSHSCTY